MKVALVALLLATAQANAPPPPTPLTIGEQHIVQSTALGEARTLNVYLPSSYRTSEQRYPVLFVIDGGIEQDFLHVAGASQLGSIWGRSREAIVVGIETKDRRKELTGPTLDPDLRRRYPTAGEAAAFRGFIRDEVKPLVAAAYRASGETAVLGESLAGLFIVDTYLREPDLFGSYAAISPSLWWDKERLSLEAGQLIGPRQAEARLFIAIANEGGEQQRATDRIVRSLPRGALVCYVPRPDLTHATIYHTLSPAALQFLFPPETAPDPETGFVLTCK